MSLSKPIGESVYRPDEVYIDGTYFPIWGQVRRTGVTPFPPKMTLGDYTRDSKVIDSSWVLSDFSGGIGILYGKLPQHEDRLWFSDLSTLYRYVTLGPHFRSVLVDGQPPAGEVQLFLDYQGIFVAIIADNVHIWDEATGQFGASVQGLDGAPNDGAIYDGKLYIITDTSLYEFDGSNWNSVATGGSSLVAWDDKLFRMKHNRHIAWTIDPMNQAAAPDPEENWNEGGRLESSDVRLLVYFDLSGEPAIHAVTSTGVFGFEFDSEKWYSTALTYPRLHGGNRGAVVWRGVLYVPAGEALYAYNGQTIQVVGPAKDDGLPQRVRGPIRKLVPSHGYLFCLIEADDTSALGDALNWDEFDINASSPFGLNLPVDPMSATAKLGTILATPEASWHGIRSASVGTLMGDALATSTDGKYRLWISDTTGIYSMDLSSELHNPLQSPTVEFNDYGELVTYWSDMGWTELDKVAFWLEVTCEHVDPDNTITFDIAWDGDERWHTLGTVTESGKSYFRIGGEEGHLFRTVRIRIRMQRYSNDLTATPVLQSALLAFQRRPDLVRGWELDIQATVDHYDRTARDLVAELYRVANKKTAYALSFSDEYGVERRARVVTSRLQGAEVGGAEHAGRYTLSVIEIVEPEGTLVSTEQ